MPELSRAQLFVGPRATQAMLRDVGWSLDAGLIEVTDQAATARSWMPGLLSGTLDIEAYFDAAAGVEAWFRDWPQDSTTSVVQAPADGARAWLALADEATHEVISRTAEAVGLRASLQTDGAPLPGRLLARLLARTTSGNGATIDDGGASAAGGYAHLHVTAVSGTSPSLTAKVQHSADGNTWVDLVTFAAQTSAGAERRAVSGTIQRYVRASWTVSGTSPSFTFAVLLARRAA